MSVTKAQEPGTRFGPYEIVQSLGSGGMAAVYEARHAGLGKRVAIKMLHAHLAARSVAAERFVREGRAASSIRHPNVVEVFEIGVHEEIPYLVMELLEGEDLAKRLLSRGFLPPSEAVDILLPTASAVAAAHAAGVIHRDLKPRNVFLAYERRSGVRPKVLDFGISKVSWGDEGVELTESETLLGTLEYMSPEQARCAKNASERSDQYALGVVLYECITGQKPFAGSSTYELLHSIVTAPFATPRSLRGDVPPELEAAILRAMHRDPDARFPSVQAFGRAVLRFASEKTRAWWREDFELTPSVRTPPGSHTTEPPAEPAEEPETAPTSNSLIGATLPEPGGTPRGPLVVRARRRSRVVWTAVLSAATLAAATVALAPRIAARRPSEKPAPTAVAAVVAPDRPPIGMTNVMPSDEPPPSAPVATSSGVALQARPRADLRVWRAAPAAHAAPATPAVAPPSVSAKPGASPLAAPVSAPPVERGFNGAPIVQ
jgi:serine/threonine-protein kinase